MARPPRRKARVAGSRRGRSAIQISVHAPRAVSAVGTRHALIAKRLAQIARRVPEPERLLGAGVKQGALLLPNVMTLWHEDPRYRDAASRPLRLKLRARGPSLAQLIRRVWPNGDVRLIAGALVRSGAVQRRGPWYETTGRFVSLREEPPAALAHALISARGLLHTIERNLASRHGEEPLLERRATNGHIPVSALPTIHRYVKREAGNLLSRFDAYLRRFEVPAGSEPTVMVGLAAFAFEDASDIGTAARKRRPGQQ